ncbi:MAG: hypothetical protein B7Z41_03055 [Rhizobiales bacterium 12-66-7]|nr:MAG: hypothetical protein B7Z41_03055 [Rhizobiales bacterium 12-66-7]
MFAVIFEVRPRPDQWEAYLALAQELRPRLIEMDGFLSVERFSARRTPGLLLSFSLWRDEKALVRCGQRQCARHAADAAALRRDAGGQRHGCRHPGSGAHRLRWGVPRGGGAVRSARRVRHRPCGLRDLRQHLRARQKPASVPAGRDRAASRLGAGRGRGAPCLAGAHHPRLRHVRPPRGAAILSRRACGLKNISRPSDGAPERRAGIQGGRRRSRERAARFFGRSAAHLE